VTLIEKPDTVRPVSEKFPPLVVAERPAFGPSAIRIVAPVMPVPVVADVTIPLSVNVVGAGGVGLDVGAVGDLSPPQDTARHAHTRTEAREVLIKAGFQLTDG